jgi:hypothetical protein
MHIESELSQKLNRVKAPEELWNRINENQHRQECLCYADRQATNKLVWTLVAAILIVVLAWGFRPRRDFVLRSDNAGEIREWLRANAAFDLPWLNNAAPLRLTGARLMRGDLEVACRVGDHAAKLLVAKGKSSVRHGSRPTTGQSTISWGMSNRVYTLACATPEDLRIACLLCHSSSERRISLN